MRKAQKRQIDELVKQLEQAHDQIKEYVDENSNQSAMELLRDCQNAGISIGTLIESTEGEGHQTVSVLEEYCELAYQLHENLAEGKETNANKVHKILRQKLIKVSNSIKHDIPLRKEAVFLPYKASMWDSLESVWQAADADPNCDTYVIPIPYYDRNPDGSFGQMHCEADQYPDYVPVTKYDEFDFGIHHPDMIFIHNPYDNMNLVTSIHPFFYSDKMKKVTDCLVYIPYFVTSGGVSESKAMCPAYMNADYIVIQSEEDKKYFDARIPREKFLAVGSPKFDSVVHKCQNPPKPPAEWQEKMAGKKVYFYNTSISGMLENTDAFLKKMQYIFDVFKQRKDACLIWRPHPLLESTFDSMRKPYKPFYEELKQQFIEQCVGIYDDTPDVEKTIALSDAYIGDDSSSVISLFSVSGKPLFIINNYIHTVPRKDDWRGEWITTAAFETWGNGKYLITKNCQLWISENEDYHYRFYMDLGCEYSQGWHYVKAIEIADTIYVLPYYARDMLIIKDKKIKRITLQHDNGMWGAFANYYYNDRYIFLFPFMYPYMVRYDVETETITYVDGIRQFNVQNVNSEWYVGGITSYGNELVVASPIDNQFMFVNMDTLEMRIVSSNCARNMGTWTMVRNGEELWLLPFKGRTITCWNPKTGDVREYCDVPQDYNSVNNPYGIDREAYPFGNVAISNENGKERIIISPENGNMYLSLDRETGKMEEWKLPIEIKKYGKNGYFHSSRIGSFTHKFATHSNAIYQIWSESERKLYDINVDTKELKDVEINLNYDEVIGHESGFAEQSEWFQYCLCESAFNTLNDFLDNNITGNLFDREEQLKLFSKINATTDGTCGEKIYQIVSNQ